MGRRGLGSFVYGLGFMLYGLPVCIKMGEKKYLVTWRELDFPESIIYSG